MINREEAAHIFASKKAAFIEGWKDLLKFPSVSAAPEHEQDCRACARWLVEHLEDLGFHSELLETDSKPVVFAERKGEPQAPVVLFYGHYDVQPIDPLEEWTSGPFDPTIRDERMYARGAQDNKGQVWYFLKAVETLIEQDELQCTLKIIIEGEEETGSGGLTKSLEDWHDRLAADLLMVCDTGTMNLQALSVTMGMRGIVGLECKLSGLRTDLHSGAHGGMVKNPATEIARLAATLHDEVGRVAVAGFYDQVRAVPDQDRELASKAAFDEEWYTGLVGVPPVGGEADFSALERRGFRPTVEINGIHSGYAGPGMKTIIPRDAVLKITARLVPNQDPQATWDLLAAHLAAHAPQGLNFEITAKEIAGGPVIADAAAPAIGLAKEILDEIGEKEACYIWEGGSVPVIGELSRVAGAQPLLVGFGLEQDNMHAPNESFSFEQMRLGFMYACLFLSRVPSRVRDGGA